MDKQHEERNLKSRLVMMLLAIVLSLMFFRNSDAFKAVISSSLD